MKQTFTILLFFFSIYSFSQEIDKKSLSPFVDINKPLNYKRFQGKISLFGNNQIGFDDKKLFIINTSDELIIIFEIGILYPELIIDAMNPCELSNITSEVDSSVVTIKYSGSKTFNSLFGCDSLTVSDFRELKADHNSIKVKTFSFLLFHNGLMNPTEYFIELTNDIATNEMEIEAFINGAKLTGIWKGSILI